MAQKRPPMNDMMGIKTKRIPISFRLKPRSWKIQVQLPPNPLEKNKLFLWRDVISQISQKKSKTNNKVGQAAEQAHKNMELSHHFLPKKQATHTHKNSWQLNVTSWFWNCLWLIFLSCHPVWSLHYFQLRIMIIQSSCAVVWLLTSIKEWDLALQHPASVANRTFWKL